MTTTFEHLQANDPIHILEITGTFRKSTVYNLGSVVSVSAVYDEPLPPQQYPMPNQPKKKLIDITISCDGEQKKLSVSPDRSIITDSTIGLTVATDKQQIVNMVKTSYNECKAKKEALAKYDEEMNRCENILKQLEVDKSELDKPISVDNSRELTNMKKELDELKSMYNQALNNPMVKQFLGGQPKPNLPTTIN